MTIEGKKTNITTLYIISMLSATCVVHVDEVLDLVSIQVCNYSLFNMTNIHCIGQHFNSFVEKNLSCFLCDKVLQYKFYIDAF